MTCLFRIFFPWSLTSQWWRSVFTKRSRLCRPYTLIELLPLMGLIVTTTALELSGRLSKEGIEYLASCWMTYVNQQLKAWLYSPIEVVITPPEIAARAVNENPFSAILRVTVRTFGRHFVRLLGTYLRNLTQGIIWSPIHLLLFQSSNGNRPIVSRGSLRTHFRLFHL